MAGFVYDKKQLPQVIGLGALSVGLLGYFGFKMITPPPTQAAAAQANSSAAATTSSTDSASNADSTDPGVVALIGAAAPSDAMRDPFAAPTLLTAADATAKPGAPKTGASEPVPGLPSLGQVQPLPVAQAAPASAVWEVTGIIRSDDEPDHSVAIFRSGEERRYIRLGDMVDGATRLIGIDRGGVTISHNNDHVRLALGASLAAPSGTPARQPALPGALPSLPAGLALPPVPGLNTREAAPTQANEEPKPAPPGIPR